MRRNRWPWRSIVVNICQIRDDILNHYIIFNSIIWKVWINSCHNFHKFIRKIIPIIISRPHFKSKRLKIYLIVMSNAQLLTKYDYKLLWICFIRISIIYNWDYLYVDLFGLYYSDLLMFFSFICCKISDLWEFHWKISCQWLSQLYWGVNHCLITDLLYVL